MYVVHACALSLFCLLCIHVQVSTRLLCSSSPAIYWLAALLSAPPDRRRPVPPAANSDKDSDNYGAALKLESRANLDHWWRSSLTDETTTTPWSRWIKLYFVSYAVAGSVLFANFLPWT